MQTIKFPYGISNFLKLVRGNYFFSDKTPFVAKLENLQEQYLAFLRPRRIGKSLFVSILEYYYDIRHKEIFKEIFGKYYIGQNPTPNANAYYVLKMDFSAIDTRTEESAYHGFLETIKIYLGTFNNIYKVFTAEQAKEIQQQTTPELAIKRFFDLYHSLAEKPPIYLIIDEYDHFTNEILIQDLQQFKKAVTQNGYVRKFYESIKIATQQGIVDRLFITGVSPVTLDSLTSGFNIITHLTTEIDFHDMMGFTEPEVSQTLDLILQDSSRKDLIMKDLRDWYNGYCFHLESPHTIYNSDMVLYCFKHFQRFQEYPREMLDPNIAPDYGKLRKMFEIQNPEGNYALLEKILYQGKITGNLIVQFSFDRGFEDNQFISFLYYMGYLTLNGEENLEAVFTIPNYVIKELYWEYFAWLLTEREKLPYTEGRIREAVRTMIQGNLQPFMAMITDVLQTLSNRDYQNFDEKYIKMLMIAYVLYTRTYQVYSERETPEGYMDLAFIAPNNRHADFEYAFELKYLKKSEATESKILEIQAEAATQIRNYIASDSVLASKRNLLAYTLVFVKDQFLITKVEH